MHTDAVECTGVQGVCLHEYAHRCGGPHVSREVHTHTATQVWDTLLHPAAGGCTPTHPPTQLRDTHAGAGVRRHPTGAPPLPSQTVPPRPAPARPAARPAPRGFGGGRRAARAGGGKGSGPGAPRPPPRVAAAGARREQSSVRGGLRIAPLRIAPHGPARSAGDEESLYAAPLALARHCLGGR